MCFRKELFGRHYPYYSSFSNYWLDHAKNLSKKCIDSFKLDDSNSIIEIASNDGYLLKNFIKKNIPVLGIEPSSGPANISKREGIDVLIEFFTLNLAKKNFKEEKLI